MGSPLRLLAAAEIEDPLIEPVVQLLNVAISTVGECGMCYEKEDAHASTCPVPVLEAWFWDR